MAISLTKGQKVDLTKNNPGLKNVLVGLGWDINRFDSGSDFDLDASAFLVQENGKVSGDQDFIKLPFAVMTVQFAHYHGCLNGEIFAQIITNDFLIGVSIDQTNQFDKRTKSRFNEK